MKHRFQPASDQDIRSKKNKEPKAKQPREKRKIPFVTPSLLVFSTYALLLFSKIVDLTLINRENEYYTVVILQLMIFMLPGAIWCKYRGEGYIRGLRMRLPRPSSFLIIISGTLLMISPASTTIRLRQFKAGDDITSRIITIRRVFATK